MNTVSKLLFTVALTVCSLSGAGARAGVFSAITVDGDISDWSSIPVAFNNATGAGPLNISSVKFANDTNFFYILVNYGTAINPNAGSGPNLYLALDNDGNASTGFNIFGVNRIGAEAGWQNDTGFGQSSASFNTGSLVNGNLGISPYNTTTSFQEFQLSRAATFGDGQTIFPNNAFVFGFYSQGNGPLGGFDEFATGNYDFAAVPEPGTCASTILMLAGLAIWQCRRFVTQRQ